MSFSEEPAFHFKQYRINEIEHIASEQHKLLGENLQIPIDIDEIVEKYGIDLDVYPGLQANHNIMGMVGPDRETEKQGKYKYLLTTN